MKVYTYNSFWAIRQRIYKLGDWKLPFSFEYNQLAYFIVGLLITYGVTEITGLLQGNVLIRFVALPIGVAKLCSSVELDGKKPHKFFYSMIRYFFSVKILNRCKRVKKAEIYKYDTIILRI